MTVPFISADNALASISSPCDWESLRGLAGRSGLPSPAKAFSCISPPSCSWKFVFVRALSDLACESRGSPWLFWRCREVLTSPQERLSRVESSSWDYGAHVKSPSHRAYHLRLCFVLKVFRFVYHLSAWFSFSRPVFFGLFKMPATPS